MCGIVGFVNKKGKLYDDKIIRNMMKVQTHRGPDDSGICGFSKRSIDSISFDGESGQKYYSGYFGFNRLSIIDVSS